MKMYDIPLDVQQTIPVLLPTEVHYMLTDNNVGQKGIINEQAGREMFGDQWEVVLNNQYDGVWCELFEVTVH